MGLSLLAIAACQFMVFSSALPAEPLPEIVATTFPVQVLRRSQSNRVYLFRDQEVRKPQMGRIVLMRRGGTNAMAFRIIRTYDQGTKFAGSRIKAYGTVTRLNVTDPLKAIEKLGDFFPPRTPEEVELDEEDLQEIEAEDPQLVTDPVEEPDGLDDDFFVAPAPEEDPLGEDDILEEVPKTAAPSDQAIAAQAASEEDAIDDADWEEDDSEEEDFDEDEFAEDEAPTEEEEIENFEDVNFDGEDGDEEIESDVVTAAPLKIEPYDEELDRTTSPLPSQGADASVAGNELESIMVDDPKPPQFDNHWAMVTMGLMRNATVSGAGFYTGGGIKYGLTVRRDLFLRKSTYRDSFTIEGALSGYSVVNFDANFGDSYSVFPLAVTGRYNLHLNDDFGLFGYLGLTKNLVLAQVNGTLEAVDALDAFVPSVGLGSFIRIGPRWWIRTDIGYDLIGLGVALRF